MILLWVYLAGIIVTSFILGIIQPMSEWTCGDSSSIPLYLMLVGLFSLIWPMSLAVALLGIAAVIGGWLRERLI